MLIQAILLMPVKYDVNVMSMEEIPLDTDDDKALNY